MTGAQFWQLQEFAKNVDVHYTTLNDWSNLVERKKIHYINRAKGSNKKVYDELDLKVFKYIKAKREDNWSLEAIMDTISEDIPDLRPFPEDFNDNQQVVSVEQMKQEFMHMMSDIFEKHQQEMLEILDNRTKEIGERLQQHLPKPTDPAEERANRVNQMITEQRVRHALEMEALEEWGKLPESERMKKAGLFRKEKDTYKREKFIREYVHKHFESKIKEEFGM